MLFRSSPKKYLIGLEAIRERGGLGIPIFKPREDNEEIITRFKAAEQAGAIAVGIDIDADKVAGLQAGVPDIYEQGLEPLLRAALDEQRVRFSTHIQDLGAADVVIIAVGTPQHESGEADLSAVYTVAEAVDHPQVRARNMLVSVTDPEAGICHMAGNPIKMSAFADPPTRPPMPGLDEHRQNILDQLKESTTTSDK